MTQTLQRCNLSPISVTVDQAAAITGLSRKTLDAAIHTGILKPINTGASGNRQLLLHSDLVQLLTIARDEGLTLNGDLSHMAAINEKIKNIKKRG